MDTDRKLALQRMGIYSSIDSDDSRDSRRKARAIAELQPEALPTRELTPAMKARLIAMARREQARKREVQEAADVARLRMDNVERLRLQAIRRAKILRSIQRSR